MRRFSFVTVDVFTDRRFGGNPLAVFPDAEGLDDGEMQSLAAEFNLSETTFVLPPTDPANTARVRIFNRTAEMPFAGHPNVGTGWVLAGMGRARDGLLRFEEIAGLVEVRTEAAGRVTIAAPQPLSLGDEMPVDLLAGCIGIDPAEIVVGHHRPVVASVGNSFVIAEVTGAALSRAVPNGGRFAKACEGFPSLGHAACRSISMPTTAGMPTSPACAPACSRRCRAPSRTPPPAARRRRSPLCCCRSASRTGRATTSPRASRWDGRACWLARHGVRPTASAPASAAAACRC
jgi:predicted PhzF superfamily epimerase YddE/YHI9